MLKALANVSAYKKELYSLILLLVVAFGAPVLPHTVLHLLDNVLVSIVLVIGVLFAVTLGPVIGIVALMAVAMLYMERNRSKVERARFKFSEIQEASDPAQMTVAQEGQPQETVYVREFERAKASEAIYLPGPKVGDDDFEAVLGAPDLNNKKVQPTVPLGEKSAPLFKNYLA